MIFYADEAGERLDAFLARRMEGFSRSAARADRLSAGSCICALIASQRSLLSSRRNALMLPIRTPPMSL